MSAANRIAPLAGRHVASGLIAVLLLAGCASLPPLEGREPSTVMVDTADTHLGQAAEKASLGREDESGIYPLQDSLEAFAARVLLARAAERCLDVQYYIWHADNTGYLMLGELRAAAERGVRVRLLLDDNGIRGLDPMLGALDSHRNIEVRLFNPFKHRRMKALGFITDFKRANRRMHNKSFTADSRATIVGGRNIGDEYYGTGRQFDFADFDVLAIGKVGVEVGESFDRYWNSESAYPADLLVPEGGGEAVEELDDRIEAVQASSEGKRYLEAVRTSRIVESFLAQTLAFEWAPVDVIYDDPAKVLDEAPNPEQVLDKLREELGDPEREMDLVSSYFVPGKDGTAAFCAYPQRGVQLRIFTNSLATTDVGAVHAGYAKRREPLLRCGAEIYELKPDATPAEIVGEARRPQRQIGGSSTASLHAKTFVVDRERVFVGSLNIDPRSVRLNTELGFMIESPTLAKAVSEALDRASQTAAYELTLVDGGKKIEWVERTEAGEVRYRKEPRTGFFQRLGVKLMSWLPIEPLL